MPIVRILLVLLALASPALAQDGARDVAAASEAAQAFQVYVEGVTKQGGRPDRTRPDVAAMLGRVFDLGALNALPPAQASDTDWLVEWHEAANATHELVLYCGAKPGPQPDVVAGRPIPSVLAVADGPMPSCLSALTCKTSTLGLRPL
jgi:hypothetical protein